MGSHFGFGKTGFRNKPYLLSPFGSSKISTADYIEYGVSYFYSPREAVFTLGSGLAYRSIKGRNYKLNYVSVPLDFNIELGHKFQFTFGPSLYLNIFVNGENETSVFYGSAQRITYGFGFSSGFAYQFENGYRATCAYRLNYGMVDSFSNASIASSKDFESDGFLKFGISRLVSFGKGENGKSIFLF